MKRKNIDITLQVLDNEIDHLEITIQRLKALRSYIEKKQYPFRKKEAIG